MRDPRLSLPLNDTIPISYAREYLVEVFTLAPSNVRLIVRFWDRRIHRHR